MGLGEVARFATLPEAEIACSALRAAGFQASVFDRTFAANDWTSQFALSGLRVLVPAPEVEDARALIGDLRPSDREALLWTRHPKLVTGVPLAILAASFPLAGWPLAVLQRRFTLVGLAIVLFSFGGLALIVLGPNLLRAD